MPGATSDTRASEITDDLGRANSILNPGALLTLKLKQTVLDFEKHPMTATREIREYSESFPQHFSESSIAVLLDTVDTPGGTYLLKLLLAQGSLVSIICSPFQLRQDQAHLLVERSKRIDPFFEWKLFRQAADEVERGWERNVDISMRALDLLAVTARSAHQIPVVKKLLQHPNPKVRSRAATMMVKVTREMDWVSTSLDDNEPRVRANALEAFWNPEVSESVKSLLWTALSDIDNRVVGNALLGLYRQGDKRTVCFMLEMATDPSEKFRSTAVWLLGQTGQKELLPEVQKLVRDSSLMVRRAAVRAARNLNSVVLPPPKIITSDSPEDPNSPKDGPREKSPTAADKNGDGIETAQTRETSARLMLLLDKADKSHAPASSEKSDRDESGPAPKQKSRVRKEEGRSRRR